MAQTVTVALAANAKWLDRVWYFRGIPALDVGGEIIPKLASLLVVRAYIADERLPVGQLYILRKGWVTRLWRFMKAGHVWGEDFILKNVELIDHAQAVALTYAETYTLRRRDLKDSLAGFPSATAELNRAMRRITIQRALLLHFAKALGKPHGPSSFIPRSRAKGFAYVSATETLDQKLESLLLTLSRVQVDVHKVARIVAKVSSAAVVDKHVRSPMRPRGSVAERPDERIMASEHGDGHRQHQPHCAASSASDHVPTTGPHPPASVTVTSDETDQPAPDDRGRPDLEALSPELLAQINETLGAAVRERREAIAARGKAIEQHASRVATLESKVDEMKGLAFAALEGLLLVGQPTRGRTALVGR